MSAIITLQMLLDESACKAQVEKFRELFGESVNVTVAEARKVADKFDWRFAVRFLDAEGRADYERVTGPAWAEYERARRAAWAAYRRVRGPAWADYDRVTGPAWAEYERVTGPAWASAYIATCARRKAVRVVA